MYPCNHCTNLTCESKGKYNCPLGKWYYLEEDYRKHKVKGKINET